MPSYFDRRTIGSTDSSHHRAPSGYHAIGAPGQFASADASRRRGNGPSQGQHPPVAPNAYAAYQCDNTGGPIPPPPGHAYDGPCFRCARCGESFASKAELDRHSWTCGAAALVTEMFTPYTVRQSNGQPHQQPPPHLPPPCGPGDHHQDQYQNHHHQWRRA